jgi:hypothetical protein
MRLKSMRAVITYTGVGVLLLLLPLLSAFLFDAIGARSLRVSETGGPPEVLPPAPPLPAIRPAVSRPAPPVTPKPVAVAVAAAAAAPATPPAAPAPIPPPATPPVAPPRCGDARADGRWPETLRTLMEKDFQQALTYVLSLPPGQGQQLGAAHMLFGTWARQDPQAALQAAQRLPEAGRQAFLDVILAQWVRLRPEEALAYLASSNQFLPDVGWPLALQALSAITRGESGEPLDEAARQRMLESAFSWLNHAGLDAASYDRAIVQAIHMLSGNRIEDAAAVLSRYAASGRMSAITDPELFEQLVGAAKGLGGSFGSRDYAAAVEWGRAMPANSAAQAYFLSNVAYSQAIQGQIPDISWLADMKPGLAQVRVIAATAMGLLNASGQTPLGVQLKRQLDSDRFDPNGIAGILQQSSLPDAEKSALLTEITRNL